MSEGISAPFIRYPIGTSLMMAGILFVGLVAYPLLPVAPLPQVDFPTIQVAASLPGASPETMASSVAQPLERQFAQIPGVAQMTSTSYLGTAAITIQFDLNRNIDAAANDVQAAINAASGQLPKNLPSPPTYRKVNPADSPILLLSATSDTLPLTDGERRRRRPARAADQPDLRRRPRSSSAASRSRRSASRSTRRNSSPRACRWRTCAARSRSRPSTARRAISTASAAPTPSTPTTSCRIPRTGTTSSSPTATAARCGSAISARPSPGPKTPSRRPGPTASAACSSSIFKQPGANVIETVDKIKATLPRLVAAIPPAIKIEVISDRTQTIRAAVEDVQFTLLLTIALVVMVIFIFLRSFWATIIPTVTVPLALLGACALMWVFGYTLDNLSLMALTIAVGFVVDDAIVMLENITRYIEEGEEADRRRASRAPARSASPSCRSACRWSRC